MNGPWPITATFDGTAESHNSWTYSAMSEWLEEHPEGDLTEIASERVERHGFDRADVTFYESGRVEVEEREVAEV